MENVNGGAEGWNKRMCMKMNSVGESSDRAYCFAVVLPKNCLVQVGKDLLLNVQEHLWLRQMAGEVTAVL